MLSILNTFIASDVQFFLVCYYLSNSQCFVWFLLQVFITFKISFIGTITSSSPTAQPAEVLLQATPPHRRARSAAWSYIFLPEEAWCDLTIHLPAAVLLKEIHIQPHLASLASE